MGGWRMAWRWTEGLRCTVDDMNGMAWRLADLGFVHVCHEDPGPEIPSTWIAASLGEIKGMSDLLPLCGLRTTARRCTLRICSTMSFHASLYLPPSIKRARGPI